MKFRGTARLLSAAVAGVAALTVTPIPGAAAQSCPDVQLVFARGTGEPPGVGGIGQSFVDSLVGQAAPRSVDVYPVNYPASSDFGDRVAFARTVIDGIRDGVNKVEATAAACPRTKIVLGGYSQGAAVAAFVTSAQIPTEVPAEYRGDIPSPMPPAVADHVAAVVLFGKPSPQFIRDIGAPPVVIGPAYTGKTLDLCNADDTICNGAPLSGPNFAHALYGANGMTEQGASYAVARLAPPAPSA